MMPWSDIIVSVTVMPLIAFVVGLFLVLLLRKEQARIQRRYGPPFFQPVYDIVKLFGKETQISHGLWHDLGIVALIGGNIAVVAFIPMPGLDGLADKGDVIVLVYLLMVPALGMALGVGQCANPNGSIGISRALTSMLAYDIPFMIVIVGVAAYHGSTSLTEIVALQQQHGVSSWGISTMPVLAVAGLITTHVMLGKEPFETYVAPAEIATGPMVEMGGKYLGGMFVAQSFHLFVAGAIYTVLFLGGGENWLTFLLKVVGVVFIPLAVTVVFPRFKVGEGTAWVWKWPTSIGLIGLALIYW